MSASELARLPPAGVASADQLGDPAPVSVEAVEVARAPQQQGLLDGALEMAVPALDGAVLVCDARVVAGRTHAVVGAQGLIAARLVLGCVARVQGGDIPGQWSAGALLDRLTHHVSILTMNRDSYRLKQSTSRRPAVARAEQNQATAEIVDPDTGEITTS